MKHILTTLMLCVSSLSFSQDTLQIPALELEEFFLALDTLETQDSIKTILIKQLEKQIEFHLELNDHNESILSYKDQEIELLNNQIIIYTDRLNQVDRWYKKPWVGVVGGFVGTIVLINTIDYTLPQ
jgi:restriction endonuclease S subunit